jgi:hypothetical protein
MSKLITFKRRHSGAKAKKTSSRKPAMIANPPLGVDIVEYIGPGFAAFAATRFVTRVAAVQIAKRYPRWGKHAGAVASVGAFAAAWLGAHRVRYLEKYHHPIVVGSGIAALQSLIQLYVPMLGWTVSDASSEMREVAGAAQRPAAAPQVASTARVAMPSAQDLPPGFSEVDEQSWYAYNDAFSRGAYGTSQPPQSPMEQAAVTPVVEDTINIDDLLDNSDLNLEDN